MLVLTHCSIYIYIFHACIFIHVEPSCKEHAPETPKLTAPMGKTISHNPEAPNDRTTRLNGPGVGRQRKAVDLETAGAISTPSTPTDMKKLRGTAHQHTVSAHNLWYVCSPESIAVQKTR